jgi:hypothetical protein
MTPRVAATRTWRACAIAIVAWCCLAAAPVPALAAPPQTTISSGPGELTNDRTPTFAFTADRPATFTCAIDATAGGMPFPCSSPFTAPALPDGGHTFSVVATSGAETDPSPATRAFTVDATPPETTITAGPPDGAVIEDDAPAFGWASSEAPSTFSCVADGVALASCEALFANGAREGPHSFTVAATDAAGNTDPTPARRSFTVDLPAVPSLPARCRADGRLVVATDRNDVRTGTSGADVVFGRGGSDLLRGLAGSDCLAGQSGNDRLFGGSGRDSLLGGTGADILGGATGSDRLYGDAGRDRLAGGAGSDLLDGGAGDDRLSDASGRDRFVGGAGNDTVVARDATPLGRRIADSVRCGGGTRDVALVDRRDVVARDCERVRRR